MTRHHHDDGADMAGAGGVGARVAFLEAVMLAAEDHRFPEYRRPLVIEPVILSQNQKHGRDVNVADRFAGDNPARISERGVQFMDGDPLRFAVFVQSIPTRLKHPVSSP